MSCCRLSPNSFYRARKDWIIERQERRKPKEAEEKAAEKDKMSDYQERTHTYAF